MKQFNLKEALSKRRIIPFSDGPKIVSKELAAAEDDLKEAKASYDQGRFKWSTIQAYYCFFHTSRALLYQKKYREKSHIQLAYALKELYVKEKMLPEEYYDNFMQALALREMADYKTRFSQEGAARNIQTAEVALNLARKLLEKE